MNENSNKNKSLANLYNLQAQEYDVVTYNDLYLMSDKNSFKNSKEYEGIDNVFYRKKFSYCQYKEEWEELFCTNELNFEVMKEKSVEGKLKNSYFRSVCWRCLLGILHKQPGQWLCQLQTYRKHYNEVCLELEHNPWSNDSDVLFDNPLSQESESIWQKYFCDEELKSVILQDVKRTFPDFEFFRNDNIQKIMVRILFCYARQNPLLCYRQGMHEILAPLILVLYLDHQAFLCYQENNLDIGQDICEILSPEFLEHDAYSIFKNIMSHIQCSYKVNNMRDELKTDQNEVLERLEYIKTKIFHQKDPELSTHLDKLDIPMHLFGIRWLRLLFGREFLLEDLLVLWDFLFANNLEYINYMVVAMLVAIRHLLLNGDYNTCLCTLMKYPNEVNINWIIAYVLHLKDPTQYSTPTIARFKPFVQHSEQHIISQLNKRNSLRHLKVFSTQQNLVKLGRNGSGDAVIVHGFVPNDSTLPEIELQQIKMILKVVHHKLLQFHSILKGNLQKNVNPDIGLVIDEIYELSCLLKNYENYEIERACEAGEDFIAKPHISNENLEEKKSSAGATDWEKKSHTLPKVKKGMKSGELKIFKQEVGGSTSGVPVTDPLHLIKKTRDTLNDS